MSNFYDYIWVEKYRPEKIEDCILPEKLKSYFKGVIKEGQLQNMLFSGTPGIGKTSVAKALCNDIGCSFLVINASEENGIETLRTKIKQFVTTVSFNGKPKVVILDEADYLNANSVMPALRGFIEEFSSNCRFIFTCNNKNRIISALQSRLTHINFDIEKESKQKIALGYFNRIKFILNSEKITFKENDIITVISLKFPDFRSIINTIQRYVIDKELIIDRKNITNNETFEELLDLMISKNWNGMREWVVNNIDGDINLIIRKIYETFIPFAGDDVPSLVVLIGEYQYKSAFVIDQEINLVSMLTEIMGNVRLKR